MYVCKHYGKHRARGKSIRKNQAVLASGYEYHVTFKYKRQKQGFVITSREESHNHEIGPEIYGHYSENRRLEQEHQIQSLEMLTAGSKPSLVRNMMDAKTSKVILRKDLHNIKHSMTKK